jgi:hypothetical protein
MKPVKFSVCARLCTKLFEMMQVPSKLNFEEFNLLGYNAV